MSSTFSNALAGLNANALAIDVVSGNLANLNTAGYQTSQVSFSDLVNGSLGATGGNAQSGSTIATSGRQFSQGAVQSTTQPFDAAIQGNGFFVLRSADNAQSFTRAGNFKLDASGHLLTADGQFVEGWNASNGVLSTSGGVSDIILPMGGVRQPSATTKFTLNANLNSNAVVGSPDAQFSSPMPVIDAQGSQHIVTVTYTKTAANTWDYAITVPSPDLAAGAGAAAGATTNVGSGTLTFDGQGILQSPTLASGPIAISITGLADGASDMAVNWNLYDGNGNALITQYSQASANLGSTQDGVPSGQLTKVGIGANGQITATYSNGDAIALGQIAVATILNPSSMQDLGNNTFGATSASALPAIGMPGTGSRGQVLGGALESSTVDIAKEFTNLLTYERGYQASSKVITTENDVMQQTVNLIR
jgi:flagellar hook protein FlgE